MDKVCKDCGTALIAIKKAGLCLRCYRRNYSRKYRPIYAARHKASRKGNGFFCACGCGGICYRGHDKILPGHKMLLSRLCACGCGGIISGRGLKTLYILGHNRRGKTQEVSEETRFKMSLARKGKPQSEAHRLAIARGLRKSEHTLRQRHELIRKWAIYREWRKAIFARDNYTCQVCGARNGKGKEIILEADHIIPFAIRPDLILSLNNGQTLCRECHKKTRTWGEKVKSLRGYKQSVVMQLPLELILE